MRTNLLKFCTLLCLLFVGIGNVWGDVVTGSWDLTSTMTDWTASGNDTYFSMPYGYKKVNGTLKNASISDFSTSGITEIKVGFKCLQNGGTTSKLTIFLVDKDGKTLGDGKVVTPVNATAASKTTYQYATFTSNLTGATGFMMKVTTFGKNILVNGAEYTVTYTPSTKSLNSLTISGTPTKTTYEVGEALDPAGLVVTGTYSDASTATITEGIEWTLDPETLTAGATTCDVMASVGQIMSEVYTVTGLTVKAAATKYNVNLTQPTKATIAASPTSAAEGATVTLSYSNVADHYHFASWYVLDGDAKVVTVKENEGVYTFTMPGSAVEVEATFEEDTKHNAIFMVNGTQLSSTAYYEGDAISFENPSTTEISSKKFVGWVSSAITGTQSTTPTFVTSATMGTADVTYYAVYATESAGATTWEQVTTLTGVVEGTYVIKNGSYVLSNAVASSSAPAALTAPAVSGGKITGTVEDNMVWKFTSTGTANQFYVKNPDGKYLYETSNNNGLRVNTTSDKWTFENNTNGYFAMKGANNSRYCAKYKDGDDWRSYTSATATNYDNSGKIELYKKVDGKSYSDYCTSVAARTLEKISVTGTPAEFWKGETFNHDGMTVTATWSDGDENVTASADFSTPDMTTSGDKTVTVSYKGKETTYTITVKTIENTQATAYTTAEAIAKIDAGKDLSTKVYVKGTISKIDGFNSTYGSITYWLDSDAFEVYGGLNNNGEKFTSIDDIKVNGQVVVYGTIKKFTQETADPIYEMDKNNSLVSYTAPAVERTTATMTLGTYQKTLAAGDDDEYTVTYNGDAAVEVSSSDETVAEAVIVDGTVVVSALKAGTTTITVSAPQTDKYTAISKSYDLEVFEAYSSDDYLAVVSLYDGKYYAMGNTVDNKTLNAVEVNVINGKVVNASDAKSISWKLNTDGTIEDVNRSLVSYSKADVSLGTSSSNSFTEESDDNGFYWLSDKRTFVYRDAAKGFKTYVATNAGSDDYGTIGYLMPFSEGYTRTVTSGNFGTICLPYAVSAGDVAGATFFEITKYFGSAEKPESIELTEVASLEAGVPYIFKAESDAIVAAYSGEAVSEAGNNNGLYGTLEGFTNKEGNNIYVISNNQILKLADNGTLAANRAYIDLSNVTWTSTSTEPSEAKGMVLGFNDTATAIDEVSSFVNNNGIVYDMQGRMVQKPVRGLYIQNGKKYLMK